jgi:hypothetical protein
LQTGGRNAAKKCAKPLSAVAARNHCLRQRRRQRRNRQRQAPPALSAASRAKMHGASVTYIKGETSTHPARGPREAAPRPKALLGNGMYLRKCARNNCEASDISITKTTLKRFLRKSRAGIG